MTTRCALAPEPTSGQTSSERLFAGGRRNCRRCSRGRVRACRSSRECVADASSRHLAVSPPRLLAVAAATYTHPIITLLVLRTLLCRVSFFIFFVRYTRTTVLVLYASLSLRVAARIFAFLSHYFCVRRAAAPSVIEFHHYVFAERSRRIYVAL